jgi:hypothetical protein
MTSEFNKRKFSQRALVSLCGRLVKGTKARLSHNESVSRRWRPTSVCVIPSLRAAAPLVSTRNNCPFFGKTNMRFQAAGSNFRVCHSERSRGIWPTIVRVLAVQGQIPPLRDAAHHSGRNDSALLRGRCLEEKRPTCHCEGAQRLRQAQSSRRKNGIFSQEAKWRQIF